MGNHILHPCKDVEMLVRPRIAPLGGMTVARVLPYVKKRQIGPFIFLDQFGPMTFGPGQGLDVRPHPHIGLATVTYLFKGEIRHRDSLGFDKIIKPGDVNLMLAGRGIVHSERTGPETRKTGQTLHGIQTWIALPETDEECEPTFLHYPKSTLPEIEANGVKLSLIIGDALGERSPVKTFSPTFCLAAEGRAGATLTLPSTTGECGLFLVSGSVRHHSVDFSAGDMVIFEPGARPSMEITADLTAMILGGDPLGDRKIWWNFVSSSKDKIEKAKQEWLTSCTSNFQQGPFSLPTDETEFIPAPNK